MSTTDTKAAVSGLILAGGRARRLNNRDKGLLNLAGNPLVARVIERLKPQVDTLAICANRNLQAYGKLGYPVISDDIPGFQGPLAGISVGFRHARHPWLLVTPCDTPLLPRDLVARLHRGLVDSDAEIAIAHDGERGHFLHALLDARLVNDLNRQIAGGERSARRWVYRHRVAEVDFSDQPEGFLNINTQAELDAMESSIRQ